MTDALGVPVHRAETIAKLAGESDIVVTTTPATAPLIEAQHLRPGMTVIAMGSDAPTKNEVAPAALAAADGYFRSEEHTSELQSLMRNSYAVLCWKKNKQTTK